jgi:hypothetical protein
VGISITIFAFNPNMWAVGDPFFTIGFKIMMTVYMYSMMAAIMLGAFVVVGSKDNLWIYKKAPNGVKNFVWSVYIVHIFYAIIIGIIFSIVYSIIANLTLFEGFMVILFAIGFQLAMMAIAIGMAFIFPTFEERGGKLGLLIMLITGIVLGGFFVAIFANLYLVDFIGPFAAPIINLVFLGIVGYGIIRLGIRKLMALE